MDDKSTPILNKILGSMVLFNKNLLDKLKNKDSEAWGVIYREYKDMIIKLVIRNSGDEEEAEDLVQNVMISLFENIQKNKVGEDSTLKNYIYTLALNQWRYKLRKLHRNPISSLDDSKIIASSSGEMEEFVDYHEKLDLILANIKEKCKQLMHLRYSSVKKSMDEIALICGLSNARSAISQLNKCMNYAKELAMAL